MTRLAVLAAVVLSLVLVNLAVPSGDASLGTLDQHLDPEPASCGDLDASVGSTGPQRQEFVPGLNQLLSVELCVTAALGVPISIGVCEGNANQFCAHLATGTANTSESPSGWVHIDLDGGPLAVTPGAMYTIEAPDSSNWAWRGSCAAVNPSCPQADGDLYQQGAPDNSASSANIGDFGFRTYGANSATPTSSPTTSPTPSSSPSPTTAPSPTATTSASPTATLTPSSTLTPTTTPMQVQRLWADFNCSNDVTREDGVHLLGAIVDVHFDVPLGCPVVFQQVMVDGVSRQWGDLDCLLGPTVADALALFLHKAGLVYEKDAGCPEPDQLVQLS